MFEWLKAASAGPILTIIGVTAASGLALSAFTYHKGHENGVDDCEAAQAIADNQVRDLADAYIPDINRAEGTYSEDLKGRGETYEKTITQAELAEQYRYGLAEGRAQARRDMLDEGLAARPDRCLSQPFIAGSDVQDAAVSLQGDVFGNSDGGDSAQSPPARLRNQWPARRAPVPDAE